MRIGKTVILGLMFLATGVTSGAGQNRQRPSVESLRIEGNTAFPTSRITGLMAMRPAGFLQSTKFSKQVFHQDLANILAFYDQNGYLDARIADTIVQLDTVRNQVGLAFRIEEGSIPVLNL